MKDYELGKFDNESIMIVHCLFEQSGTFKNAFKKFGYDAYDYDIDNLFGETDYQVDLFQEIQKASDDEISIFDNFNSDDLVLAFFPCTYFSKQNRLVFSTNGPQFSKWSKEKIDEYVTDRKAKREYYFNKLIQLIEITEKKNISCIIENPSSDNYLNTALKLKPSVVINDRSKLGDYFVKPTMFYFLNIRPKYFGMNMIIANNKKEKTVNQLPKGITRSLMHPVFAHNFIDKYILGD